MVKKWIIPCLSLFLLISCSGKQETGSQTVNSSADSTNSGLPQPSEGHKKFSEAVGWPVNKRPVPPPGFKVDIYARGFVSPRWIYELPNGDILIAEANTELKGAKKAGAALTGKTKSQRYGKSANRITLLRDANKDGIPELRTTFLENLKQPFGMLLLKGRFYVANTDGVWSFPYKKDQEKISDPGKKIIDLPAGGYNNHWTRNLIANRKGTKIFISVGSGSNVAEHGIEKEKDRAAIWEINPDGSGKRIFAGGLRNPVGMDWQPGTDVLWTAVNERDDLGDSLVPDYITSVKEGAFYGWPWAYIGRNEDPRLKGKNPEMVKKTIAPDFLLGAHTASLGLAFYNKKAFPEKYHNGVFIGQRGSWNHSQLVGYKVVFVPFKDGRPAGKEIDFLTGFIANREKGSVYGRPVGVCILSDGSMLVADDTGNTVWRVRYGK